MSPTTRQVPKPCGRCGILVVWVRGKPYQLAIVNGQTIVRGRHKCPPPAAYRRTQIVNPIETVDGDVE